MKTNPLPMTVVIILGIVALTCIVEDRISPSSALIQLASTAVGALASILVTNAGKAHDPEQSLTTETIKTDSIEVGQQKP